MAHIMEPIRDLSDKIQAMVFCPTKNWCEKLTSSFAKYFEQLNLKLDEEALTELKMNFIENGVKQNSLIFKNAEKGVAFHHAGMMTEERNIGKSSKMPAYDV